MGDELTKNQRAVDGHRFGEDNRGPNEQNDKLKTSDRVDVVPTGLQILESENTQKEEPHLLYDQPDGPKRIKNRRRPEIGFDKPEVTKANLRSDAVQNLQDRV